MQRLKKILSVVLILIIAIPYISNIYAYVDDEVYMQRGVIKWTTEGKKRTSSIYYKTIGWNVHKQKIPSGNVSTSGVPYGKFYMQQVDEYASSEVGNVITVFECLADDVKKGLAQAKDSSGKMLEWKNGETVYLSAIIQVRKGDGKGGYTVLGTYNDLEPLRNSQSWASPGDFDQYFNKPLKLDLLPEEVHKKIKIGGELISDEVVDNTLPGEFSLVKFDEKIEYKGKTYSLQRSCIENRLELGHIYADYSIPPYTMNVVSNRNVVQFIGGINVYGMYVPDELQVTIQHYDKDTMQPLKEDEIKKVSYKDLITTEAEQFEKKYLYNVRSYDGGATWHDKNEEKTRTYEVIKDTIDRSYYSGTSDLIADVQLSASPNAISEGKTETVKFTGNGSGSKGKYPIVEYRFWFGSSEEDLTGTPDYAGSNPIYPPTRNSVEPGSYWKIKLEVVDSKGNTAIDYDDVTIDTIRDANVKVFAGINSVNFKQCADADEMNSFVFADHLVNYIDHIDIESGSSSTNNVDSYTIYVRPTEKLLDALKKDKYSASLFYDFDIDASKSWSTNSVGRYDFSIIGDIRGEQHFSTTSSIGTVNKNSVGSNQKLTYELYYMFMSNQTIEISANVTATDKIATTKSATSDSVKIYIKAAPLVNEVPDVNLSINKNLFRQNEEAFFTPSFSKEELITAKKWTITNSSKEVVLSGEGNIPTNVKLDFGLDDYTARQYIYYLDSDNATSEDYAEVNFKVVKWDELPPDVTISCDKEKYLVPTIGYFTTTFTDYQPEEPENKYFNIPIQSKTWALKLESGQIVAEGDGVFPSEIFFDESFDAGYYIAEQTIYYKQGGVLQSKTASCKFKVYNERPAAALDLKMKTYTDWQVVDQQNQGMQYKKIRIDLSRSDAFNKELENPYDILWDNENTQIAIKPLDENISLDKIQTTEATTMEDGFKVIKKKKFIDVRFDQPGWYRIKGRVVNEKHIGNWRSIDIYVTEDLVPLVTVESVDKTTRQDDLHVRFDATVKAKAQDIDAVDYQNAKLYVSFDFNGDGVLDSKDGAYFNMMLSKSSSTLQPGFNITYDDTFTSFKLDIFLNENPVLGLIELRCEVGEIPYYPDYVDPSFTILPLRKNDGKNETLSDNNTPAVEVELSKKRKVDVYYYTVNDKPLNFDINDLKSYFGQDITLKLIKEECMKNENTAQEESNLQGNGTSQQPYLINNAIDFKDALAIINDTTRVQKVYFKQTSDVTYSGEFNYFINVSYDGGMNTLNLTNSFKGFSLDEKSELKNLNIKSLGNWAVIEYNYGYISNITTSASLTSGNNIGGLSRINYGTIEDSTSYSTIYSPFLVSMGGIAYENYGIIRRCSNRGSLYGQQYSDFSSNILYMFAGGIAGINNGTIEDCYNAGTIETYLNRSTGIYNTGGIVGYNKGVIKNCYNVGTLKRPSINRYEVSVGANLVGATTNNQIYNCYGFDFLSGRMVGINLEIDSGTGKYYATSYLGETSDLHIYTDEQCRTILKDNLNKGRKVWMQGDVNYPYPILVKKLKVDATVDHIYIGDNTPIEISAEVFPQQTDTSLKYNVINTKTNALLATAPITSNKIIVPTDNLYGNLEIRIVLVDSDDNNYGESPILSVNKTNILNQVESLAKESTNKVVIVNDDQRYYEDNAVNRSLASKIKDSIGVYFITNEPSIILNSSSSYISAPKFVSLSSLISFINNYRTLATGSKFCIGQDQILYFEKFFDDERDYYGISLADKLLGNANLSNLSKKSSNKAYIRYTHSPEVYDNAVATSGLNQVWYQVSIDWNAEQGKWQLNDSSGKLFTDPTDDKRGKWKIELKTWDVTTKTLFDKEGIGSAEFYVHKAPIPKMKMATDGTIIKLSNSGSYDVDYQYSKNKQTNVTNDRSMNGIKEFYWSIKIKGNWIDIGVGPEVSYDTKGAEVTDFKLTVQDYDGAYASTSLLNPLMLEPIVDFNYHLGNLNGIISDYFYRGNKGRESVYVSDAAVTWNDEAWSEEMYGASEGRKQVWENLGRSFDSYNKYNSLLATNIESMFEANTIHTKLTATNKFGMKGSKSKNINLIELGMKVKALGFMPISPQEPTFKGTFIGNIEGVGNTEDVVVKLTVDKLGIRDKVITAEESSYIYSVDIPNTKEYWTSIPYTYSIYSDRTGELLNVESGIATVRTPLTLKGFINDKDGHDEDIEVNTDELFKASAQTNEFAKIVTVSFPVQVVDENGISYAADTKIDLVPNENHTSWVKHFMITGDTIIDDTELEAKYEAISYNDIDKAYDIVPFMVSGLKLELFRVVQVRDLKLESFYKDFIGKYRDVDMFVNSMAVDPAEYYKYGYMISSLTKGYQFEFEIDSRGFNDDVDTIVIEPSFYAVQDNYRDPQQKEAYWIDSNKKVWKVGEGGHSNYKTITLTKDNRELTGTKTATWRGKYFIPGTTFLASIGSTTSTAKANEIKSDIIVAFHIVGYKNGVAKFDYNIKQWSKERTEDKIPYKIGDVIRYGQKSNLDDLKVYRTN